MNKKELEIILVDYKQFCIRNSVILSSYDIDYGEIFFEKNEKLKAIEEHVSNLRDRTISVFDIKE